MLRVYARPSERYREWLAAHPGDYVAIVTRTGPWPRDPVGRIDPTGVHGVAPAVLHMVACPATRRVDDRSTMTCGPLAELVADIPDLTRCTGCRPA